MDADSLRQVQKSARGAGEHWNRIDSICGCVFMRYPQGIFGMMTMNAPLR